MENVKGVFVSQSCQVSAHFIDGCKMHSWRFLNTVLEREGEDCILASLTPGDAFLSPSCIGCIACSLFLPLDLLGQLDLASAGSLTPFKTMRINLPQPTFFFLLSSLFLFYIPHPNAAHLALTPAFVSLPTSYCFENSLDGSSDLPGTQFYFTSVPNLMGTKCVF